jgi:hypothetical protein
LATGQKTAINILTASIDKRIHIVLINQAIWHIKGISPLAQTCTLLAKLAFSKQGG